MKALWVLAFCTPDFVLPDDLETIEDNAFEGAAMTAVEISGDCEYIGAEAFKNCKNLTRIYVPEYCQLGENVFEGCVLVYVFGTEDSPAQDYCDEYENCVFVEY